MKKQFLIFLAALLIFSAVPACAGTEITHPGQLNAPGIIVGISQGSAAEGIVQAELPRAGIAYFTDNTSAYMAVAQGKIDAYVFDLKQMRLAIESGVSGVHLLDETMGEPVRVAAGISPASKIPGLREKLNRFIGEIKADGTLDDMLRRWLSDSGKGMPDIAQPEKPALHLTVGTSGIVPPYSYYEGTSLTGFDIELARRFAAWLGADVQFKVYDYGAIIPAAVTGDVDCIMANLNITPERQEVLPFSDLLYEEKLGVMVRGEKQAVPAWRAYNGKRIGVVTGGMMEAVAQTYFPDSEYVYLNGYPDCIAALMAGKIDAYLGDEPELKSVRAEQPQIGYILPRITNQEYSFAFRKNDPRSAELCRELNAFLARCREDGTLQELDDIWFGTDESRKTVDMSDLTGEKGSIRVVTTSTDMPFSYIKDGKNVGYDIDLVVRFCRYAGYQLVLGDVDFAARIPAVQSGKFDFTTDMNVTEERKEQVLFSDPTSSGGVVLAVLSGDPAQQADGQGTGSASQEIRSLADLDGKRIGIPSGSSFDLLVKNRLPNATLHYLNSQSDLLIALADGKIDAFPSDEPAIRYIMNQNQDVTYLSEYLDTFEFAYCFDKTEEGRRLCDQFSAFIVELKESGELDRLAGKWFSDDESEKPLPDLSSLSAENGVLRMATEGNYMPFEYVRNGQVVGYDVEIAVLFCQAYGYGLKIDIMNLDAVLPAVQSGKCDFGGSALTITPERAESVLFSEPNYSGGTVMVIPAEGRIADQFNLLSQLNGKRIGVQTGSNFDELATLYLPDAEIEFYNTKADLVAALTGKKVDAFIVDEPVGRLIMQEDSRISCLPDYLGNYLFALVFDKDEAGEALRDQFNAFLRQLPDGTLEDLAAKWFGENEEAKTMPDVAALPATNGVLRLATESGYAPFEYVRDGRIVGYDMELAALFCEACGYGLEIVDMNFDGVLPAVQTGKCDFAAAGISITPERAENVLFSDPNYSAGIVAMVLKADEAAPDAQAETFWDGIAASFRKTFLRESRWKLFLEGVGNTTLITLLSILCGTALGFLLFMLCRNGNPAANAVTRFSMWLVTGTPMVVLLMILYYIIFGRVEISGIAVAVIGFTLTFGASVFGLLKMGVGTIDPGQYEAAYALGHSNRRTFFKIILPQAIPHVLPAYQGEIVGLIKATAIVGYIAVQDLTKMGDIVRSRTYEAFFPLIAVTVIYFVLEGLFSFLVSRIRIRIDPKKRSPERILKGVNRHD